MGMMMVVVQMMGMMAILMMAVFVLNDSGCWQL